MTLAWERSRQTFYCGLCVSYSMAKKWYFPLEKRKKADSGMSAEKLSWDLYEKVLARGSTSTHGMYVYAYMRVVAFCWHHPSRDNMVTIFNMNMTLAKIWHDNILVYRSCMRWDKKGGIACFIAFTYTMVVLVLYTHMYSISVLYDPTTKIIYFLIDDVTRKLFDCTAYGGE